MRRAGWILPAVAALALALVACGPGDGSTSSAVPASDPPTAGSAAAPSDSAVASTLDTQSIAWFDTLCPALSQSIGILGDSGISDTGATVQQLAIVSAAQQAGEILGTTATALAAQPPPTFDGGEQVVDGVTAGMTATAQQLAEGASTFSAIDPADPAALQSGRTAFGQQIVGSLGFLQDLGDLDPVLGAEIAKIPSCAEFAR